MQVGIELTFKDGSKNWIDPVDVDEFNQMLQAATDKYIINNGAHSYEFLIGDVAEYFIYNIHECCGYDTRSGHSRYCGEDYTDA
ncbi:hypothetical protein EKK58_12450 [Candidatus Dependentiae bacterium]|nr:MAG: hypothetical protein EKK58_12450 [Candidatus Dependentiae bacterium]